MKLAPEQGSYHNTLGVALYYAGAWQASLDALDRSMHLRDGGDAWDFYFVAMARHRLGDADARSWFERAIEWAQENKPNDPDLGRFRAEAERLLGVEAGR